MTSRSQITYYPIYVYGARVLSSKSQFENNFMPFGPRLEQSPTGSQKRLINYQLKNWLKAYLFDLPFPGPSLINLLFTMLPFQPDNYCFRFIYWCDLEYYLFDGWMYRITGEKTTKTKLLSSHCQAAPEVIRIALSMERLSVGEARLIRRPLPLLRVWLLRPYRPTPA